MKRRVFLVLGSIFSFSSILIAKNNNTIKFSSLYSVQKTIASVQEHLFPEGSKLPSAKSTRAIDFLLETITHHSYDKDIRLFIVQGAKELEEREKGMFISLSEDKKEQALRAYEDTSLGSNWLSQIMVLTLEGILSDPIYGSNIKKEAWVALGTHGGEPRPKRKYIFNEV
ncbi:MAG: gluconate 2-dehydrogenase subunit 3 family protein [Campylobacterota bacterium]|nr:gluconate 2-dehydrogenase subunit 3 family protein [Campylobacterota bacterium]